MDDDKIDLFQGLEIVPIQLTHLPHGFYSDRLVVRTVDLFHEIYDVADELKRPLHKIMIPLIDMIPRGLVVILHQFLNLRPDAFQNIPSQFNDQLLVAFGHLAVVYDPVVHLELLYEVAVDLVYVDCVYLALDYLEVLVLAQQLRAVDCQDAVVEFCEGVVDGGFVDIALVDHFVDVLVGPEEVVQHEAYVRGELDVFLVVDLEGFEDQRLFFLILGDVVREVVVGYHLAGFALVG